MFFSKSWETLHNKINPLFKHLKFFSYEFMKLWSIYHCFSAILSTKSVCNKKITLILLMLLILSFIAWKLFQLCFFCSIMIIHMFSNFGIIIWQSHQKRTWFSNFENILSMKERISGLLTTAARYCYALNLFRTASKAWVRLKHLSSIDFVYHQYQTFIITKCISFFISNNKCKNAFFFLFQIINTGYLIYITVQFPQH
jgi:hypothetical protein